MPRANNRGVVALVLGILGFVGFGCLTGIAAWIVGGNYIKDVEAGGVLGEELGLAQTGRILGMVSTGLLAIGAVFVGVMMIIPMMIMGLGASAISSSSAFPTKMVEGDEHRSKLLDAVVAERMAHPKSYGQIATELNKHKRHSVSWFNEPIKPAEGCGAEYTISAENGNLVVTDACGFSSLVGWPAQRG